MRFQEFAQSLKCRPGSSPALPISLDFVQEFSNRVRTHAHANSVQMNTKNVKAGCQGMSIIGETDFQTLQRFLAEGVGDWKKLGQIFPCLVAEP